MVMDKNSAGMNHACIFGGHTARDLGMLISCGTKETVTFATEEVQNRSAVFAMAILQKEEAILWL